MFRYPLRVSWIWKPKPVLTQQLRPLPSPALLLGDFDDESNLQLHLHQFPFLHLRNHSRLFPDFTLQSVPLRKKLLRRLLHLRNHSRLFPVLTLQSVPLRKKLLLRLLHPVRTLGTFPQGFMTATLVAPSKI